MITSPCRLAGFYEPSAFGSIVARLGFAFRAVDPPVFLGGYDYRHVAVLPKNEHRFVLDCIEERAEALSGSGSRNSLHISI
jgi:hypothetical protein